MIFYRKKFIIFLLLLFVFLVTIKYRKNHDTSHQNYKAEVLRNSLENILEEPIIFVGGYMSSGTSLMRSILDVHPEVKCGPEIKITTETFSLIDKLRKKTIVKNFMEGAGIKKNDLERALGLFSFYLYSINVPNANRICNKEPANLKFIEFYQSVFPNSKFIYVVRDGREAAFSSLKRWTDLSYEFENFYKYLFEWNKWNNISYTQCLNTGPDYCKVVRYENLVQNPKETIEGVADFLDLEWTDKFLNHQDYIATDIKISKKEPSIKNIKKEINTKSIGNWVGKIKNYDEEKVKNNIQMLNAFGYV